MNFNKKKLSSPRIETFHSEKKLSICLLTKLESQFNIVLHKLYQLTKKSLYCLADAVEEMII